MRNRKSGDTLRIFILMPGTPGGFWAFYNAVY